MAHAAGFTGGVEVNFKYLSVEVTRILEETQKLLENPSPQLAEKISSRDDYIDTMRNVIESRIIAMTADGNGVDRKALHRMWAVNVIAHNMEHIADLAVNIADQTRYLPDIGFARRYDYRGFFIVILEAMSFAPKAFLNGNINAALKMCRAEAELDRLYAEAIAGIIRDIKDGTDPAGTVTMLLIFQCAERIGDSLLNIGEAVISAVMGEKMKIHQYRALEKTMGNKTPGEDYTLEAVGETRSGTTIRKIKGSGAHVESQLRAVFKEGKASKLAGEKENISRWELIEAGLPPKVYGYQVNGKNASIVMEYINGDNLKEIVINGKPGTLDKAMASLTGTMNRAWEATLKREPCSAGYLKQLSDRLGDVYRVHPEFRAKGKRIGGIKVPSFEEMLESASAVDASLQAPFSVFLHGDLNVDNILYDSTSDKVHFIDLHRSCQSDYVQDISVFIASNFRMPFFDWQRRKRINYAINAIYGFAAQFAESKGDRSFQARLAVAMVRSFITSTRFEFDSAFAGVMYHRAVYIMEKMQEHRGRPWEEYVFDKKILIY
ncbi:MAG: phosphotransferase [Spirochaetia bacterium]|nr:phosphotransferase [Spirochaetia bacterium]